MPGLHRVPYEIRRRLTSAVTPPASGAIYGPSGSAGTRPHCAAIRTNCPRRSDSPGRRRICRHAGARRAGNAVLAWV